MKMPKPTAAHKKLHKLAGKWSGKETLAPSPWDAKGGTAVGKVTNEIALDGYAVVQDYVQKRKGKTSFLGHGVFRYDADKQEYQMLWLDSVGAEANVFRGTFEGDVLSLTSPTSQGQARCTFEVKKKRYRFSMDVSPDGAQWVTFMSGEYQKK